MAIGYQQGKCRLCGKEDSLNEGICAAHSSDAAQGYLFGYADGKHEAEEAANTRAQAAALQAGRLREALEKNRRVGYEDGYGCISCGSDPCFPGCDVEAALSTPPTEAEKQVTAMRDLLGLYKRLAGNCIRRDGKGMMDGDLFIKLTDEIEAKETTLTSTEATKEGGL